MSNSKRPLYTLRVELSEPGEARVTVFDAWGRVVLGPVEETSEKDLPAGLFTVRTQRGSEIHEQDVRLAKNQSVPCESPPHFSAAPLAATATTHEYYAEPSARISREETAPPLGVGPLRGSVFIFVRASSRQRYDGGALAQGLYLRQAGEAAVSTLFAEPHIVEDRSHGWLAYSAKATAGNYRLGAVGSGGSEIPLHIIEGWQTQVFVTYHGRPLLDSMTVFLAPDGRGFQPGMDTLGAADLALQSLRSGSDWIPGGKMYLLLAEKFDNPMLGVFGAHLLLRRQRRNPTAQRVDTLNTVLDNLLRLIGPTPDLRALYIMAARFTELQLDIGEFNEAPMLQAGTEAVIAASIDQPDLIPANGSFARHAAAMRQGMVWTAWEVQRSMYESRGSARSGVSVPDLMKTMESMQRQVAVDQSEADDSWVQEGLKDVYRRWEVRRVADDSGGFARDMSAIDHEDFLRTAARDLALPRGTIERVLNRMIDFREHTDTPQQTL